MDYLTFEEYTSMGGIRDETAFLRNIDRACSAIDNATFNRVSTMGGIPRRIKVCCRDLVEYFSTNLNVAEKGVESWSQSAGTVSESVAYSENSADDITTAVNNIIADYLSSITDDNGTPLLYLGALK